MLWYWKHAIYYAYKLEKLSYRNTVSILVFQAKVVNFQETKLLACLIEENATRCLWLQWKVIAISNTFWYKSKNRFETVILWSSFNSNDISRLKSVWTSMKNEKILSFQLIKYSKSRMCMTQCVELVLRWQFCVYGSTSPEIYLYNQSFE